MDVNPVVIPGLTRDPVKAARWTPAFAGVTAALP